MSNIRHHCGSAPFSEIPSIIKARYDGYSINILSDKEFEEVLPFCTKRVYNVKVENPKTDGEVTVGYSVTVNEYADPPEIVRITRICTC